MALNRFEILETIGRALGLRPEALVGLVVETNASPCWPWIGRKHKGRPRWSGRGGREVNVARAVLEARLGRPILPGHDADHTCRSPGCVSPAHLVEREHAENVARNRVRVCDRGHELTPGNVSPTGGKKRDGTRGRTCRACLLDRKRRYRRAAVSRGR